MSKSFSNHKHPRHHQSDPFGEIKPYNHNNNEELKKSDRAPELNDWAQEAAAAVAAQKEDEEESNSALKRLYIGNLDRRVSDVLLFRIFSLWGTIELCKIIKDPSGASLGFGFVGYYDHKSAQTAAASAAGCTIYDRELKIRWAHSDPSRKPGASSAGFKHTIFVGDLGVGVTDLMLTEAFAKFGDLIESRIVRGPSGKSKGYGFVSFFHRHSAEKAIQLMHGATLGSRVIRVGFATFEEANAAAAAEQGAQGAGQTEQGNCSVYLGNLAPSCDERLLRTLCSPFGDIRELKFTQGNTFAFVIYTTSESAAQAISTLSGRRINERNLKASWGKHRNGDAGSSNAVDSQSSSHRGYPAPSGAPHPVAYSTYHYNAQHPPSSHHSSSHHSSSSSSQFPSQSQYSQPHPSQSQYSQSQYSQSQYSQSQYSQSRGFNQSTLHHPSSNPTPPPPPPRFQSTPSSSSDFPSIHPSRLSHHSTDYISPFGEK